MGNVAGGERFLRAVCMTVSFAICTATPHCHANVAQLLYTWEGKRGSICPFAFPLFYSILGFQDAQMLGKTAPKVSLSNPFRVPQVLVNTRTWEQCPQMLAGKARGKWQKSTPFICPYTLWSCLSKLRGVTSASGCHGSLGPPHTGTRGWGFRKVT